MVAMVEIQIDPTIPQVNKFLFGNRSVWKWYALLEKPWKLFDTLRALKKYGGKLKISFKKMLDIIPLPQIRSPCFMRSSSPLAWALSSDKNKIQAPCWLSRIRINPILQSKWMLIWIWDNNCFHCSGSLTF
jgi:hypothetical protein